MKRRTFLQLSGMTAASALLAGCQSGNEKLIPYLVPPDEGVTPGLATYYASACRFCPAGCGILVRVAEGRAKKIEGNPAHPVNRGKLCARGQAVLQELYHPDRIQQPLRRNGPRGSRKFTKISWQEGLELLTVQLKALQQDKTTDRLALVTPQLRGTLAELTTGFMAAFGSANHLSYELLGLDWLRTASSQSFGQPSLPFYDLSEARYLLSFGADFVESHLSPVHYGYAFGQLRQARDTVRGHFTYVGGRMSLTGASADRWLPTRPGSEGALALGLARLILADGLYDGKSLAAAGLKPNELLRRLEEYDLPRVAEQTGLTQQAIVEVAREFATTRPALAMAGETVAFQTNGPEAVRAVQLLNLLVGNLNQAGGIFPDGNSLTGATNSFTELLALVDKMRVGRIQLALIHGDPVHAIPPATGFQEALARVPFVVSFSSLLDDTALQADLILPDHSALESWGDVLPVAGSRQAVIGLMQPVVTPLYDTRQFADVLLATADKLGGGVAAALPYPSYLELLQKTMQKRVGRKKGEDFEGQWVELLRQGGLFPPKPAQGKGYRWLPGSPLPLPGQPRFAGDAQRFPLHLLVYPSTAFYDGRGAPLPWLQQLPDPMTTVVWDSWVEINPKTAAQLGIKFGDLVEVASSQGTLRLPAVIFPGIRPDLVAIPLGQGHLGGGRYAQGRGANPLALLATTFAGKGPQPAWHATRVQVTRVSEKGELVTAGHPQGSYRSDLIGI
jgi:anaerobic selenocysteine-containing dehydrogenase